MSTGLYGFSEVSGDPIPYARLHAIPWARHDSDEVDDTAGRSPDLSRTRDPRRLPHPDPLPQAGEGEC